MNTYLVVAVATVGALSLADLFLIVMVARRVTPQSTPSAGSSLPAVALPVGTAIPPFSGLTLTGESLSSDVLREGRSLIGFFSGNCKTCRNHIPAFLDYARAARADGTRVITVVEGEGGAASELADSFTDVGGVILEPEDGPVARAFSVWLYPTYLVVDKPGVIGFAGARLPASNKRATHPVAAS
jgi:thiol-disulfide isomerase/thioredoxin